MTNDTYPRKGPWDAIGWRDGKLPTALAECMPLKIGALADILAASTSSEAEIRNAITWHCSSPRYLDALATEESQRCELDGRIIEPVAPEHRYIAAVLLHRRINKTKPLANAATSCVPTLPPASPNHARPKLTLKAG